MREFTRQQLLMIFKIAENYGGIGSKLQFGFGRFIIKDISPESPKYKFDTCLNQLKYYRKEQNMYNPYDLKMFVFSDF